MVLCFLFANGLFALYCVFGLFCCFVVYCSVMCLLFTLFGCVVACLFCWVSIVVMVALVIVVAV